MYNGQFNGRPNFAIISPHSTLSVVSNRLPFLRKYLIKANNKGVEQPCTFAQSNERLYCSLSGNVYSYTGCMQRVNMLASLCSRADVFEYYMLEDRVSRIEAQF